MLLLLIPSKPYRFIRSLGEAAKTAERRFLHTLKLSDDPYFQVRCALIRHLQNGEIDMEKYKQCTRITHNANKNAKERLAACMAKKSVKEERIYYLMQFEQKDIQRPCSDTRTDIAMPRKKRSIRQEVPSVEPSPSFKKFKSLTSFQSATTPVQDHISVQTKDMLTNRTKQVIKLRDDLKELLEREEIKRHDKQEIKNIQEAIEELKNHIDSRDLDNTYKSFDAINTKVKNSSLINEKLRGIYEDFLDQQNLKDRPFLPSQTTAQDRGKQPLEGAITPATDQLKKKIPGDMISKLTSLKTLMYTFSPAHKEEIKPIVQAIIAMEIPYKARDQDKIQNCYDDIIRSINGFESQTKDSIAKKACKDFLSGLQQQDHQTRNLSSYAEQGSTEPEAIAAITQRIIEWLKKPKGQFNSRHGIRITDEQCTELLSNFREFKSVEGEDRRKFRQIVYCASDGGKATISNKPSRKNRSKGKKI